MTDAAHMLRGCAGYDPQDPASANVPVPDFTSKIGRDIKGMKIGLIKELYEDNCDPKVKQPYDEALKVFESLGAELIEVPGLTVRQMQAIEWPTLFSEAASIHIRNQRGPRVEEYNPHTWQFLQYGLLVSAGYYHNAQRARAQVRDSFLKSLNEKVDVLMTPTVGFPVPLILDESPGLSIVAGDFTVYTAIFNQSGLPAMQVPCGFDDDGLPVGLQIAGKPFDERDRLPDRLRLRAGSRPGSTSTPICNARPSMKKGAERSLPLRAPVASRRERCRQGLRSRPLHPPADRVTPHSTEGASPSTEPSTAHARQSSHSHQLLVPLA